MTAHGTFIYPDSAALWGTIGLVFAASVERVDAGAPSDTRLSSLTN